MTSRINWAIQSSGVDYLHLLIISMDYLTRLYNLDARLAVTVHDEIRYLVKEEDKYKAAMALQVANVWTRAIFSQQMGINELPQSCAYFSAVDIDHVLRKEVDMDCVTPSHKEKIPHGESLDIVALLEKGEAAHLDPAAISKNPPTVDRYASSYTPRIPVMKALEGTDMTSISSLAYIKAQITGDDKELREVMRTIRTPSSSTTASRGRRSKKMEEDEETDQNVLHYEQMARLMPVDEVWQNSKLTKSWGTTRPGTWHNIHPRSTAPRNARV